MADEKETQNGSESALKQMKLLLMIVLVVALVAPLISSTMTVKSIDGKLAKLKLTDEPKGHAEEGKHELPMAFYSPLEFLVNLGDTEANHYLRATVSLGVQLTEHDMTVHAEHMKNAGGGGHGGGGDVSEPEPVLFHTIKVQEPIVRDTIISLISNYTMDALVASAGKKELKEAIREKLRSELHNEHIEVYFTAFTLQ